MLRKSIFILTLLILLGSILGPLSTAKAQSPKPDCPLLNSAMAYDEGFLQSRSPKCGKTYRKLLQREASSIVPQTVGGPDAFGYTYDDTVAYNWVAASTNTGITGDDEVSGAMNIGFSFPFYGINYSQLYFNTNGGITLGSESYEYGGFSIPDADAPNNLIAPFWEDLVVGTPDNSGAIFYAQGGTAPNRYFFLEWRAVTTYEGSSPFSFEAILHENGDIVTQFQSLPASYYSTVGVENSIGDEGLLYQKGSASLSAPKAIRFYYPTALTSRVLISPLEATHFSTTGGTSAFTLTVVNTGNMGSDTYDLSLTSPWATTLYEANGITPLTDTDIDGTVDTGSVSQGSSVIIIAKVVAPGGAAIGNINIATLTAHSSLNISKSKTAILRSAIAAPFVQILSDSNNHANFMSTGGANGEDIYTVDSNASGYRYDLAITPNANGRYLYAWSRNRNLGSVWAGEIEYALVKPNGSVVRPAVKLTDNSGAAINTYDQESSVAATPNGNMAILWERQLYNSTTDQSNYNIYLAVLDGAGNLLSALPI